MAVVRAYAELAQKTKDCFTRLEAWRQCVLLGTFAIGSYVLYNLRKLPLTQFIGQT